MTLNIMFFTLFEDNEVVIADMLLQDLTLLFICQYQYELFPQKTSFYFELFIMNLTLLTMKVSFVNIMRVNIKFRLLHQSLNLNLVNQGI